MHISQLANRFVKDPSELVKVGQKVSVKVLEVDLARHRIALSMRDDAPPPQPARPAALPVKPIARPEPRRPASPFDELWKVVKRKPGE